MGLSFMTSAWIPPSLTNLWKISNGPHSLLSVDSNQYPFNSGVNPFIQHKKVYAVTLHQILQYCNLIECNFSRGKFGFVKENYVICAA